MIRAFHFLGRCHVLGVLYMGRFHPNDPAMDFIGSSLYSLGFFSRIISAKISWFGIGLIIDSSKTNTICWTKLNDSCDNQYLVGIIPEGGSKMWMLLSIILQVGARACLHFYKKEDVLSWSSFILYIYIYIYYTHTQAHTSIHTY